MWRRGSPSVPACRARRTSSQRATWSCSSSASGCRSGQRRSVISDMTNRRTAVLAFLIGSLFAPGALAIETPKNARGFNPDGLYHFGNIDSVNLFNGNVIVALPIGQRYDITSQFGYQLMLSYNSNLWDVYNNIYGTFDFCLDSEGVVTYIPNQRSNVGAGWSLGYGRLFPACNLVNDIFAASYESPDGGGHAFTATLPGVRLIPTYTGPVFTDDNSHLRLRNSNPDVAGPAYLDFPDGTTYAYTKRGCEEWLLESMSDSFGNTVHVTWDPTFTTENMADPFCRRTVIHYAAEDTDNSSIVVDSVDVPSFNANPAQEDATVSTYHFHYAYPTVAVRFAPGSTACSNAFFTAPVLTSVDLPDGSSFLMTHNPADIAMQKLTLPTGGIISWDWTNWEIPGDSCKLSNFLEGLRFRTFRDPFTGIEEQWSYEPITDPGP